MHEFVKCKAALYIYLKALCFIQTCFFHTSMNLCLNAETRSACLFASPRPLVVAFTCTCMLADAHACTHAIASVVIICACALWQSGKSTEGFPQRPRCQSVCSVKGEDHLPGLGEISATCRCWGIYPSTQGKKTKQGVGGVTTHREQGVWPRKFRPHGQVQHA